MSGQFPCQKVGKNKVLTFKYPKRIPPHVPAFFHHLKAGGDNDVSVLSQRLLMMHHSNHSTPQEPVLKNMSTSCQPRNGPSFRVHMLILISTSTVQITPDFPPCQEVSSPMKI